jgi:hypothetical protein
VHERFGGLLARDERALALHPLDHALMFELRERLTHHGARDAELLAQAVLTRQEIARAESPLLDGLDDALTELAVHGHGRLAVDRAREYGTAAATRRPRRVSVRPPLRVVRLPARRLHRGHRRRLSTRRRR